MTIVVRTTVVVTENEDELILVDRAESVLPTHRTHDDDGADRARQVDLMDLTRATLDRLAHDAVTTADAQVVQLREVIAR